jgi:prepilin-type N-terminal cleavage/methylation domain-containing protein
MNGAGTTNWASGHRVSRAVRRGLTLIEVLVVVVILGLAGAMVIPAMGSTGVLRVQGAIRTLVSDITFAQSDAMAFQQARAIVFDQPNNSYRVVQVINGTIDVANTMFDATRENKRMLVNLNNPDFGGARMTSVDFGADAAQFRLVFDDLGTPVIDPSGNTPSAGGRVRIQGQDSVHEVIVEPYTGRISVRRISGG